MKNLGVLFGLFCGLLLSTLAWTFPEEVHNTSCFRLSFGNDTFVNTDRGFTSAGKLTFMSKNLENPQDFLPFKWLFSSKGPGSIHTYSLSIGQNIYTPHDIQTAEFLENDRPYAGYFYFELGLHSCDEKIQDTFILDIGIVGRHSFAKEFQEFFHWAFNHEKPLGWQHQLKDEFAFQLVFERKWKVLRAAARDGIGVELIPHLGGGLGNIYTYLSTGSQVRFGWNVPKDFGIDLHRPGGDYNIGIIRQQEKFGIYYLAGVDFHAVYRNIFLDGNTIVDSHRVEKYPFTTSFKTGIGFNIKRFHVTTILVFWNKRFKTEPENHKFGVVNISYFF